MSCKAPIVRRKIWGRRLCCYKICPYSTSDVTNRVPSGEKSIHYTTSGAMAFETLDGHYNVYMCLDDNCSFYTGTATTAVNLNIREQKVTSSGTYVVETIQIPLSPCSGTRFYEG